MNILATVVGVIKYSSLAYLLLGTDSTLVPNYSLFAKVVFQNLSDPTEW